MSSRKKRKEKTIIMHTLTQIPPTSKQIYMPVLYSSVQSIPFSTNFETQDRKKVSTLNIFYKRKTGEFCFFHSNHISRILHWLFLSCISQSAAKPPFLLHLHYYSCAIHKIFTYVASFLVLESKIKINHKFPQQHVHAETHM